MHGKSLTGLLELMMPAQKTKPSSVQQSVRGGTACVRRLRLLARCSLQRNGPRTCIRWTIGRSVMNECAIYTVILDSKCQVAHDQDLDGGRRLLVNVRLPSVAHIEYHNYEITAMISPRPREGT